MMKEILKRDDVGFVATSFGKNHGCSYKELGEYLSRFDGIVVFPGSDVDRKVVLDKSYVNNYSLLCRSTFDRRNCVPQYGQLMHLHDIVNLLSLLSRACVPVLGWYCVNNTDLINSTNSVVNALRKFAGDSPLVIKALHTTSGRRIKILTPEIMRNEASLLAALRSLFRPGFNSIVAQKYTPHFEESTEKRIFFVEGEFVTGTGTSKAMDHCVLLRKDVEGKIAIAKLIFCTCPWLRTMPHLRIDFGRSEKNKLIVSEIEPCGDIFLLNHLRLSSVAKECAQKIKNALTSNLTCAPSDEEMAAAPPKRNLLPSRAPKTKKPKQPRALKALMCHMRGTLPA